MKARGHGISRKGHPLSLSRAGGLPERAPCGIRHRERSASGTESWRLFRRNRRTQFSPIAVLIARAVISAR